MPPPEHHKEVASFLREKFNGEAQIAAYRDNNEANPIPVGKFGAGEKKLFSTIGAFDMDLKLPKGDYEFSSFGELEWLPNTIASSIYYLKDRVADNWPVVCEDVVKHNTKNTYRHMAFVPSTYSLKVSTGQNIFWLLGVPITDNEISIDADDVYKKAQTIYPDWLFHESA